MLKDLLSQLISTCNKTGNSPKAGDTPVKEAGSIINKIETLAVNEPAQVWDVLRNGSDAEVCALMPIVQLLGNKFLSSGKNEGSAGDLQKIAQDRGIANILGTAITAFAGGSGSGGGGSGIMGAIGGLLGGSGGGGGTLGKVQLVKQLLQHAKK